MWNPESRRSKSHRGERIGKQKTFRRQNARPRRFAARDHHARRAVAKQHGRNQIGLRKILALKGQRGNFHGDEQSRAIRKRGQIFPGARESRGAGRAAEFRDRQPPHVRAKSHDRGDMGVQRRNHDACARYGDEQVHVGGRHVGLRQRLRSATCRPSSTDFS